MKASLSRLLISIGVMFCVLLSATLMLVSNVFIRANREINFQLHSDIAQNASIQIENTVKNVEQRLRFFASRSAIVTFMSDSAFEQLDKVEMMRSSMDDLTLYVPMIKSIHLLMISGQKMRSTYNYDSSFLTEYLQAEALLQSMMTEKPFHRTQITDVLSASGTPRIAIAVPVFSNQGSYLGAVAAVCDLRELSKLFPENMTTILLEGNQIVLGNHTAWDEITQVDIHTVQFDGQNYTVIQQPISSLGWELVCVYPLKELQHIAITPRYLWLAAAIIIAIIAVILLIVNRMIVEPIESITRQMEEVSDQRKTIINPHRKRNELTRLTSGINEMTNRIDGLNQDILRANREKYQLELDQLSDRIMLLQTQINPHFLYNNLECIRGMAYLQNFEGVREMAVCMAHVARYSVKNEPTTIEEEIACVKDYFQIISLRYDHVYSIEFDVTEEAAQSPCPRMILQPIVENAVYHGFVHAKRCHGTVYVSAKTTETDNVILTVEDNGAGMDETLMAEMNAEFAAADHGSQQKLQECIGLYNVNYRLCLTADETSGIHLEAIPDGGLRVTATFRMKQNATVNKG